MVPDRQMDRQTKKVTYEAGAHLKTTFKIYNISKLPNTIIFEQG